jgi:hypothetical protein
MALPRFRPRQHPARDLDAVSRLAARRGVGADRPRRDVLIYTLVFSHLMRSRLSGVDSAFGYSVFLCAGLLPWTFFTESLTRLTGVFVANANLMKKATFPRICLPVIALGAACFNFAVIASLFLIFLVVSGTFPGFVVFAALPALGVQVALAMGLGTLFATLNVFFRDVGQAVSLVLQFWFWLTSSSIRSPRCPSGHNRCSRGIRWRSSSPIASPSSSISGCPTPMRGLAWVASPSSRSSRCGSVSRLIGVASARWSMSSEQDVR